MRQIWLPKNPPHIFVLGCWSHYSINVLPRFRKIFLPKDPKWRTGNVVLRGSTVTSNSIPGTSEISEFCPANGWSNALRLRAVCPTPQVRQDGPTDLWGGKNWKMRFSQFSANLYQSSEMVPWTHVLSILGDVYHIYILSTLPGLCPRFCRVHSHWIGWCFTFFAFLDFCWELFSFGSGGGWRGHTGILYVCVCSFTHQLKKNDQRRLFIKRLYIYILWDAKPRIPGFQWQMIPFTLGCPGIRLKMWGSLSSWVGFTSQLFKRQISPQTSPLSHFPSGLLQRAKMSGIQEYSSGTLQICKRTRDDVVQQISPCQWIETKKFRGP